MSETTSDVQIDLASFRKLVDVAHNLGRKHLDCDQYVAMQLVVRQAPALLALVEQQAATIARYDTALIEATRAAEEDDDGEPTKPALIETVQATDEERDRLEARVTELEADPGRGMPTRGDWRLARDRTRAAEHEAERLEAERDEARAEAERLREGQAFAADEYHVQVYELFGEWSSIGIGWSHVDRAVEEMHRMRQRDPGHPAMRVLRVRSWTERMVVVWEHPEDVTGARDASRAPESPADAPDPSNDPRSG